jgi:hypothetical protein
MAAKETAKQAKERAAALKAIEESEARIARLVAQSAGANDKKLASIEAQVKAEERKQALQEKEITRLDTQKALYEDVANSLQKSVDLVKQTDKQTKNLFKSTASVESIQAQIEENEEKLKQAKLDGRKSEVRALKLTQSKLKDQEALVSLQKDQAKQLAVVNDIAQDYASTLTGFVNKLPGGKHLSKALGIDKLGEQLEVAMTKGAAAFTEAGGGIKGITAGVRAFSGGILAALGPIALVAIAVGGLAALFSDISHKAHDISKETGLTYGQSKQLQKSSMKVQTSFDNQLSTTKDIVEVQKELLGQFGTMSMMSADQAAQVAEIGNAFGYGAKQAAQVNAAFMQMGMAADEASKAQTAVAAEAVKAGVNVGTVTKDIADNAKSTAKFFGGNVKALRKAAVQAAKMGLSIKDMASVSEKLLDIEGSLAAQFEFQALSGKQINLDKARQLALDGDIAGATKQVLDQVGSISEFNNLSMLEKKKLAEATGLEVDQLQKSLIVQDKLGDLTEEQKAAMSGLNLSAEELGKLSADQIKTKLAEQDAQKKMNASMESLINDMKVALLPLAEGVMKIFAAISPILKVVGKAISIAFMPLTYAGKMLEKIIGYAKEYQGITMVIGGLLATEFALRKRKAAMEALSNTHARIAKALNLEQLAQLFTMEGLQKARVALGNLEIVQLVRKIALGGMAIAKAGMEGALNLAKSIGSIFSSFSMIPLGLGIPLAFAAAGGMFALFKKAQAKKTGDLSMGANGGPIVASPREGAIFQGTKNDEVAMGPGVIGAAQASAPDSGGIFGSILGGIGSAVNAVTGGGQDMSQVVSAINAQNVILNQLLMAMNNPPPVQVGSKVIKELNAQIEVERSFTRAT